MAGLPALGVLRYNGYEFGGSTETTHCAVFPQYDQAGRTVTANLFTFTFVTHLKGGGSGAAATTSAEALAARRALSKPGGHFEYSGRGFCELDVNPPATDPLQPAPGVRDAAWGPKPKNISFRPLGRDGACELTWTLETTIPDCADAVYQFQALEFSFSASFDRTPDGRAIRTITGYLRVPATRRTVESRSLVDIADRYRTAVTAVLPVGFKRDFQPYRSDASKQRLDFGYTDTEMPANVPPPGVIEAKASHTMSASQRGLLKWQGQLQATYTLDLLTDPAVAVKAFFLLVKDRLTVLLAAVNGTNPALTASYSQGLSNLVGFGQVQPKHSPGKTIIPTSFSIGEPEIYGPRQVSLALSYEFTGSLAVALAGGLWKPLPRPAGPPEKAWTDWSLSLAGTYLHPYAGARMRLQASDDQIVGLCSPGGSAPDQFAGIDAQLDSLATDPPPSASILTASALGSLADAFPPPPPAQSYLYFDCELFVETDSGVAAVRPLPTRQLTRTDELLGANDDFAGRGSFDALNTGDGNNFAVAPPPPAVPPPPPGPPPTPPAALPGATVNRRAKPQVYVYLCGRAGRVGLRPEIPRLLSVGGQTPVPANRLDRGEGYGQGVRYAAGAPIYTARWMLRYALPDVPTDLPTPPNPFLGTDGSPPVPPAAP